MRFALAGNLRSVSRPVRRRAGIVASVLACGLIVQGSAAVAVDDSYRPQGGDGYSDQGGYDSGRAPPSDSYPQGPGPRDSYPSDPGPRDSYQPGPGAGPGPRDSYQSGPPRSSGGDYVPYGSASRDSGGGGYGEPYAPPPSGGGYGGPPRDDGPPQHETYSQGEIIRAGNDFFGKISGGLASAVEWAFQQAGRPNGYILGSDAGGAFVAGLSYGEGRLFTKDAGTHKVYWQGPSVGYDFGGDGSKVMTLVYNLRDPSDIYERFGGVEGSAYLVGGVSVQIQKSGHVTLAPIRAGVGLRLGANVGYLKYTRNPTWNPF
jgi:hypothetical protein